MNKELILPAGILLLAWVQYRRLPLQNMVAVWLITLSLALLLHGFTLGWKGIWLPAGWSALWFFAAWEAARAFLMGWYRKEFFGGYVLALSLPLFLELAWMGRSEIESNQMLRMGFYLGGWFLAVLLCRGWMDSKKNVPQKAHWLGAVVWITCQFLF